MTRPIAIVAVLAGAVSGCKQLDCAPGTIEQNGHCEPADVTTSAAICGPDTKLEGTVCVSTVMCDPQTTMAMTDPSTGITTCVGISGGAGCTACAPPATAGKQTICGQLYDFENMQPFVAAGATGAKCPATPATSGPCALNIMAYDAIAYAMNPATAVPLAVDSVCIDDMGHYSVNNITRPGTNPFIGLGIDDANAAMMGPTGVTNAVGVATVSKADFATKNFEAYIVTKATTDMWTSSGGPTVATTGVFAMSFRAHTCPTVGGIIDCSSLTDANRIAPQAGVAMVKGVTPIPQANAAYFLAAETTRDTIDPVATMTGANGTGLNNNATALDGPVFTGQNGITDTTNCKWETHAGAALTGIVFVQAFHKTTKAGTACTD